MSHLGSCNSDSKCCPLEQISCILLLFSNICCDKFGITILVFVLSSSADGILVLAVVIFSSSADVVY